MTVFSFVLLSEGFERAEVKQDNIQQNVIAGERRWMRGIRASSAAADKE